jgi:regulator of sigma E protease
MILVKIVLGLFGLGIVVFVHELGHLIGARLAGIDVEAFSIGWGRPILKKKVKSVEYRLGMFPVGGYCKMRGDSEFQEVWENSAKGERPEKGTFYGTSPLGRIIACFGGPFFNLVFAALVLSLIWGIGFEVQTLDNRIVLASELNNENKYPADEAGFKTGDRIIEINGKKTSYYHEVQENIAVNPEKILPVTVDREGERTTLFVRPNLDKSTGMGRIGVYFWTDTVIDDIVPGGDAAIAGLLPGDRITGVNGTPVVNTIDFLKALETGSGTASIDYTRFSAPRNGVDNQAYQGTVEIVLSESGGNALGIVWPRVTYRTPSLSPPAAVAKGVSESWKTLVISLRSLSLLFRGIKLTEAVSGPVRITYMVGDIATEGFGRSFVTGLRSLADFLALISIALCVMNLLPLPVLDGGMIVLAVVEWIRRKPIHPKAIRVFQTVGVALISGLMIFALFGDIMYLTRR